MERRPTIFPVFRPARQNEDSDHWLHVVNLSKRVRVVFAGATVAASEHVRLLREARCLPVYYFPPEDVRMDLLEESGLRSRCPYKGIAAYWSARIGGRIYQDIAWSYKEPTPEFPGLKGLVCFFQEREAAIDVDGEPVPRPEARWAR